MNDKNEEIKLENIIKHLDLINTNHENLKNILCMAIFNILRNYSNLEYEADNVKKEIENSFEFKREISAMKLICKAINEKIKRDNETSETKLKAIMDDNSKNERNI